MRQEVFLLKNTELKDLTACSFSRTRNVFDILFVSQVVL